MNPFKEKKGQKKHRRTDKAVSDVKEREKTGITVEKNRQIEYNTFRETFRKQNDFPEPCLPAAVCSAGSGKVCMEGKAVKDLKEVIQ